MQYKVQYRPTCAQLIITLQPGERIVTTLGSLVSLEEGIVRKSQITGDWFGCFLRSRFGQVPLWSEVYHNPTGDSLKIIFGGDNPGDILRLDISKSPLFINPENLVAYTSGVRQGTQWLGWSSWFAGQGLIGLKLSGKGRVFLNGYGRISQQQVHQRFGIEQGHSIAHSAKLQLKVGFPKGLIGSHRSGEGLVNQLMGGGILYFQTYSPTNLVRYLRGKMSA